MTLAIVYFIKIIITHDSSVSEVEIYYSEFFISSF